MTTMSNKLLIERAVAIAKKFPDEVEYTQTAENPPMVLLEAVAAAIAFCALTRVEMHDHLRAMMLTMPLEVETLVEAVRERV